jgi:hypothetical protein
MGQRVANDLAARPQPQLSAVRQIVKVERAGEHSDDVRMFLQCHRKRSADDVRASFQPENSAGFRIDRSNPAIARDDQHAIPHAEDQLAEEAVGDWIRPFRQATAPLGGWFGHTPS